MQANPYKEQQRFYTKHTEYFSRKSDKLIFWEDILN